MFDVYSALGDWMKLFRELTGLNGVTFNKCEKCGETSVKRRILSSLHPQIIDKNIQFF